MTRTIRKTKSKRPKPRDPAARSARRRRLGLACGIALLLTAGLCAWRWWPAQPAAISDAAQPAVEVAPPPTIETQGVDVAVAQAIDRARQSVQQTPRSADAWGELGMVLLSHNFDAEAATCFAQAAALDRQDARWPYLHARSILSTDQQGAVPLLERAVELCANVPAAPRLTLVETLLQMQQLEQAEPHLAAVLSQDPKNPRARLAAAQLLTLRGDARACVKQLESLLADLQVKPEFAGRNKSLELLLADSLRQVGRTEEAEQHRRRATGQTDPNWPDPYMNQVRDHWIGLKSELVQGDLLYGSKQYEESIALLRKTVATYPESIWAKMFLARALIRTGAPDSPRLDRELRLQEAQQILEESLKLDPNSVETHFWLGVSLSYQNRVAEAVQRYEKAVELKPDFAMAYSNLATCRERLNDPDGTAAALEGAIRAKPDLVRPRILLGALLLKQGKLDQAESQLRAAHRLEPNDPQIRQLLQQLADQRAKQGP